MPELPEVETVANGVHARVQGRVVVSVWTSGKPQTFKSPEETIAATLTGARIVSVRRVGKTIVMTVEGAGRQAEFLIHLGMTGRLLVSAAEVPLPPHSHAVLTLDDGREIRFVDARRFGRLSVHAEGGARVGADPAKERLGDRLGGKAPGYRGPGREPLTISGEEFIEVFRRRKTPIKAALLNQSLLHGVGNIYADEALFRAGIRPRRQAARLTRGELTRLREGLVEVLRRAILLGGSSVSDYVDADGVRGFFQLEHRVYRRGGEPCLVCGATIQRTIVGGRSSHYCPRCQR
ncbi:MAG: bifunctional DNA-formamidopyrimidine glycosylase/DNA-(apurinic or apyrimidinic site) lyase [Acidobacteriota bacterium]|nr:bifunctional DNA-formamidopyrimidine glycosylase/DNA-(apurinic or apyrimidinic site) lyase [Acidobacteriota bacterium]